MNKTKEEIFKFFWNLSTGKQADEMTLRHMAWVLNAMEEYGNQCRKEGFESFRDKVEEEVKKELYQMQEEYIERHNRGTGFRRRSVDIDSCKKAVLETIKEIKQ